jgi:hypothetical protein
MRINIFQTHHGRTIGSNNRLAVAPSQFETSTAQQTSYYQLPCDDCSARVARIYIPELRTQIYDELTNIGDTLNIQIRTANLFEWLDDPICITEPDGAVLQPKYLLPANYKSHTFIPLITQLARYQLPNSDCSFLEGHHSVGGASHAEECQGYTKKAVYHQRRVQTQTFANHEARALLAIDSCIDGGNLLIGHRSNGEQYAVVGRDSVLETTFLYNPVLTCYLDEHRPRYGVFPNESSDLNITDDLSDESLIAHLQRQNNVSLPQLYAALQRQLLSLKDIQIAKKRGFEFCFLETDYLMFSLLEAPPYLEREDDIKELIQQVMGLYDAQKYLYVQLLDPPPFSPKPLQPNQLKNLTVSYQALLASQGITKPMLALLAKIDNSLEQKIQLRFEKIQAAFHFFDAYQAQQQRHGYTASKIKQKKIWLQQNCPHELKCNQKNTDLIQHWIELLKAARFMPQQMPMHVAEDHALTIIALHEITKDKMASELGIKRRNLIIVSQPDFYIDMTIKPITKNKVLLNHHQASLSLLHKLREDMPEMEADINQTMANIKADKAQIQLNHLIEKQLKRQGLKVLRTAGGFTLNGQTINFLGGLSGQNDAGQPFYITQASGLEGANKLFRNFIYNHLSREIQVYFVGKTMHDRQLFSEFLMSQKGNISSISLIEKVTR